MTPLLAVDGLRKHFPVRSGIVRRRRGEVRAVDGVSFELEAGETLGLVGESGCGKTTLARCLVRLERPSGGRVLFRGEDLLRLAPGELRRRRRFFQMIFQDPYGSLNPRLRIGKALAEPLAVHRIVPRAERTAEVGRLLAEVGLPADAAARYPHEFSGGQRQRIGIARALAPRPELVVADEPVSALDVSVQAQIVDLLATLRRSRELAMVFIAHDLAVVESISDRVAVMYLGRIVESGPAREVFAAPQHPYTAALVSAVPRPDPTSGRRRIVLPGEPPSPLRPPPGCAFHPRCPIAVERCRRETPALLAVAAGRLVACHKPAELAVAAPPALQSGTF